MKQKKSGLWVAVAIGFVLEAAVLMAQDSTFLTRAQWLKKIGASVTDAAVLRETLAQIAPEDSVEFTRRMMKAVSRMPVGPEEKTAAFIRTSVACIAGAKGGSKQQVIGEVFAGVPIENLPVVSEELAKRFDQGHNKLSDEQFEKIASDTLRTAIGRNAQTDSPSVRNTFVLLAFLRGAKNPALQSKLIGQLPDERMRNLAASWIPPALKEHKYEALLAAADVDELILSREVLLRLVGHANMDRLLADLNANLLPHDLQKNELETNAVASVWIPLSQVRAVGGMVGVNGGMTYSSAQTLNFGISRTPTSYPIGYQNQGTSVVRETR